MVVFYLVRKFSHNIILTEAAGSSRVQFTRVKFPAFSSLDMLVTLALTVTCWPIRTDLTDESMVEDWLSDLEKSSCG